MPKFEFDSGFKLAETLKAMGMPNAFDDEASEFQGMDGQSCLAGDLPCLFISDVIHKAFVSVDEKGTEAAAATAVIVEQAVTKVARLPIIPVVVDRPFIFLIRDEETGAILFVGSVVELGDESWPTPTQAPQPTATRMNCAPGNREPRHRPRLGSLRHWSMAIAHSPLICTGLLERRTGTCSTRLTAFLWRLP